MEYLERGLWILGYLLAWVFLNRHLNKIAYKRGYMDRAPELWFIPAIGTWVFLMVLLNNDYFRINWKDNWFTGKHWTKP